MLGSCPELLPVFQEHLMQSIGRAGWQGITGCCTCQRWRGQGQDGVSIGQCRYAKSSHSGHAG